jgi:hypothetical protein
MAWHPPQLHSPRAVLDALAEIKSGIGADERQVMTQLVPQALVACSKAIIFTKLTENRPAENISSVSFGWVLMPVEETECPTAIRTKGLFG